MVVRMRHNRSQVRQRRSHHSLTAAQITVCSNCGENRRPHHMCLSCGYYRGRQVIDLATQKKNRAERITKRKEFLRAESGAPQTAEQIAETKPEPVAAEKKTKKKTKDA